MEVSFLSSLLSLPKAHFFPEVSNHVNFVKTVRLQFDSFSMRIFYSFSPHMVKGYVPYCCLCISPLGNLHLFSKYFHEMVDFGIADSSPFHRKGT